MFALYFKAEPRVPFGVLSRILGMQYRDEGFAHGMFLGAGLVSSSTFLADPEASFSAEGSHGDDSYFYTRWGNPTVSRLEKKLAALEAIESAMAFASGMAAITGLFFHCLRPGDHVLLGEGI